MNVFWTVVYSIELLVSFSPVLMLLYFGVLHFFPAVIMVLIGNLSGFFVIIPTALGILGSWGVIQLFVNIIYPECEFENPTATKCCLVCGFAVSIYLLCAQEVGALLTFPSIIFAAPMVVAIHFTYLNRSKLLEKS